MRSHQDEQYSLPVLPSFALRTTQRAPKSCRNCAARKVRCDKQVPCSRCIKRGEAASCARETVLVRGRITTRRDEPGVLTYEELLRENARLREALRANSIKNEEPSVQIVQQHAEKEESDEALLFKSDDTLEKEPIANLNEKDIVLPSVQCSNALLAHDEKWNSWVHYALEYPTFTQQHDAFLVRLQNGASLESFDPSWLAIYFAVITVRHHALLLLFRTLTYGRRHSLR